VDFDPQIRLSARRDREGAATSCHLRLIGDGAEAAASLPPRISRSLPSRGHVLSAASMRRRRRAISASARSGEHPFIRIDRIEIARVHHRDQSADLRLRCDCHHQPVGCRPKTAVRDQPTESPSPAPYNLRWSARASRACLAALGPSVAITRMSRPLSSPQDRVEAVLLALRTARRP